MPTEEQIKEARSCDINHLLVERYPDDVSVDGLHDSYSVVTPCDWAVLAAAYADRAETDKDALHDGQMAWANAVSRNAAYALTDELFFGYLEAPDAIAAPPFTQEPLTEVTIQYRWGGLGESVQYSITIADADLDPQVTEIVNGEQVSASLPTDVVQALGIALTGLLPVAKTSPIIVCYDNYPDWTINLTYQSGESVVLTTNGSNAYDFGGPWWASIDGQLYFQPSNTILTALIDITDALELPYGQPSATFCHGLESSLLEVLY
jgi:hypothetical protein